MATTTKKRLEEEIDYTNQPQATTQADVDAQDSRTRLWQSLNYSYGNQIKKSNEDYANAISQADRQALSRGMGRSSYNNQTLANLRNKQAEAANDIRSAQIADYQNRVGQIEQQEAENERWERQFAETQKQNEWQRAFQESEAARTQGNWEQEYAANRADTAWNQNFQTSQFNYQQQRDTVADQQWQKQYDEQLRQFNENMAYQRERANVSDAQWQKEYDEKLRQFNEQMAQEESQFKANLAFQQSEAQRQQSNWEKDYAAGRSDTAWQQSFSEKQWQAQQDQWKQEFDYNKKTTEQKLAYETAVTILGNGGDPSDALLKQAGLSRADANAMKKKVSSGGGGKKTTNTTTGTTGDTTTNLLNGLTNWNTTSSTKASVSSQVATANVDKDLTNHSAGNKTKTSNKTATAHY